MKPLDNITLDQLERRLKPLRKNARYTKIHTGWIKYMRSALGMSLRVLAKKTKLSAPTVLQSEKGEIQGKVTLATLRKMAAAMDCELVYAFVPQDDIRTLLKGKAYEKASKILSKADTHMTLEAQAVSYNKKERIQRLADQLMNDGDVW